MHQLVRGTGSVHRALRSDMKTAGLGATNKQMMHQLTRGNGAVYRALRASMSSAKSDTLGRNMLVQLGLGSGVVNRLIEGRMLAHNMGETDRSLLTQLQFGKGSVQRSVIAKLFGHSGSWTGNAMLGQLDAGSGWVGRDLHSRLFADSKNWTGNAMLGELRSGHGWIGRDLRSRLYGDSRTWTGGALLNQLQKGSGTIDRIVRGAVDLGSLTPSQQSLLASINGATAGKITLGGSFVFDPSSGFSNWFGSTVQSNIATPMSALRGSLDALRLEMKNGATVQGLDRYAGGMMQNGAGQHIATEATMRELAKIAGLNSGGNVYDLANSIQSLSGSDALSNIYVDRSGYQTRVALRGRVGDEGLKVDAADYLKA